MKFKVDSKIFGHRLFLNYVISPFLWVSSPFDSLDWGLTPVRATTSYSNEGLVASTISPCAADRGKVSAIGFVRVCCVDIPYIMIADHGYDGNHKKWHHRPN